MVAGESNLYAASSGRVAAAAAAGSHTPADHDYRETLRAANRMNIAMANLDCRASAGWPRSELRLNTVSSTCWEVLDATGTLGWVDFVAEEPVSARWFAYSGLSRAFSFRHPIEAIEYLEAIVVEERIASDRALQPSNTAPASVCPPCGTAPRLQSASFNKPVHAQPSVPGLAPVDCGPKVIPEAHEQENWPPECLVGASSPVSSKKDTSRGHCHKGLTATEAGLRGLVTASTLGIVLGVLPLPYGFYSLLRFLLSGTSVRLWEYLYELEPPMLLTRTLLVLAVLYNPFLPIHLGSKPLWLVLNLITIGVFWAALRIYLELVGPQSIDEPSLLA